MKEHTVEIFNFVAHASKIHNEISKLRNDIRIFIQHTDYVSPPDCIEDLEYAEATQLKDTQHAIGEAIVTLCSAMRIHEEEEVTNEP